MDWMHLPTSLVADAAQQTPIEFLSGASGWSAAALLAGLLSWLLFFHLPRKDQQFDKLIQGRDDLVREITTNNNATLKEVSSANKDAMKEIASANAKVDKERQESNGRIIQMVIDHCQRENAAANATIERCMAGVRDALKESTEATLDLRRFLEEWRANNGAAK